MAAVGPAVSKVAMVVAMVVGRTRFYCAFRKMTTRIFLSVPLSLEGLEGLLALACPDPAHRTGFARFHS
jgi:hypothetical protein